MTMQRKPAIFAVLFSLILGVAFGVAAQSETPELAQPETLLDVLDVPLCAEFLQGAADLDAETATQITPEGAVAQTILLFDLTALERNDLLDLIRFQSKDAVAAKAQALPVQSFETVAEAETANGSTNGLYGWMTLFYDADNAPLCRTTAYPAVGGSSEPLTLITFQGFIAQMVSAVQLDSTRYQADAFCSFDTPQYCEAIFMGDDTAENIVGTEGSDLISGAGGNDTLDGREGSDFIDGGDGDDMIIGGGGSDVISGGDGDDVIYGGSGGDIIRGDGGNDSIEGQEGLDTLDGGEGVDTVNQ
jgi:hypothetical protein